MREEAGVHEATVTPLVGEAHETSTSCAEMTGFLRALAGASLWQQSQRHSTVSATHASRATTTKTMTARTPAGKEPVSDPDPERSDETWANSDGALGGVGGDDKGSSGAGRGGGGADGEGERTRVQLVTAKAPMLAKPVATSACRATAAP